jgi:type IV pilus assembly protein PilA
MKTPTTNRSHSNHPGSGFSLIELLIVVAIILIIAAISIPSILRARIAANQAGAVENCRTVSIGEVNYSILYGGFSPTLLALGGPATGPASATNAQIIDEALSSGMRAGYVFTYAPLNVDPSGNYQDYSLNADPQVAVFTGDDHYFTDEPAVIHVNHAGPASVNDPPIQ